MKTILTETTNGHTIHLEQSPLVDGAYRYRYMRAARLAGPDRRFALDGTGGEFYAHPTLAYDAAADYLWSQYHRTPAEDRQYMNDDDRLLIAALHAAFLETLRIEA